MKAGDEIEFERLWGRLSRGQNQSYESLAGLAARLAYALSFRVTKRDSLTPGCDFVETRPSHYFYDADLAVLYAVRLDDGEDVDQVYSQMAKHACDLGVADTPVPILMVRMPEELRQRCAASSVKFVLISEAQARQLLRADGPRGSFENLVRHSYTDPQGCPFVIAGPVGGRLFYGRQNEIRLMAQPRGSGEKLMRSYAIIGPRKSGKTSLLHRILETIEQRRRRGESKTAATYLSLKCYETAHKAMEAIVLHVNPRLWNKWTPWEFERLMHREYGPTDDHMWLLDECDNAIQDDLTSGEHLCRALTTGSFNRVVLAGHSGLWRTKEKLDSELWNAVEKIDLYGLEPPDAKNLFEDTFRSREWYLRRPKEVLDYVLKQTQRMPNLIQLYGAATWHHVNKRGDRHVSLGDVRAAEEELLFREEIVEPLVRHEDPLARLVMCMTVKHADRPRTLRDIIKGLEALGAPQSQARTSESLADLEHFGLLRLEKGRYWFTNQVFPRLLRSAHDLALLRKEAITELRKGG